MDIEITVRPAETALHNHGELWVKAITEEPLGPGDWQAVEDNLTTGELHLIHRDYAKTPCSFWAPDHARRGFEQWWVFPKVGS